MSGSTAIHSDSSVFVSWANNCILNRGWQNISNTSLGKATHGNNTDAFGKADGQAVSLGDGGSAILSFQTPITNGPNWDFAVFENAFNDDFLELAFVEVSSNGTDFVRFPAHSITQTNSQITAFGVIKTTLINNLAGKYKIRYGTPFDLAELSDSTSIDISHITHIRIIDVVGSINPLYGNKDTANNFINDPFPTPFATSGFDLDAVGVINQCVGIDEISNVAVKIYPNPTKGIFKVFLTKKAEILIFSSDGVLRKKTQCSMGQNIINLSELANGYYFIEITTKRCSVFKKIVKI
jgi:hypothetical protein